jgi:hypothetical protein
MIQHGHTTLMLVILHASICTAFFSALQLTLTCRQYCLHGKNAPQQVRNFKGQLSATDHATLGCVRSLRCEACCVHCAAEPEDAGDKPGNAWTRLCDAGMPALHAAASRALDAALYHLTAPRHLGLLLHLSLLAYLTLLGLGGPSAPGKCAHG